MRKICSLISMLLVCSCSIPSTYLVLPTDGSYYELHVSEYKDYFVFDYTIYPCKIQSEFEWNEGIVLEGRDTIVYAIVNSHMQEFVTGCKLNIYKHE